WAERRDAVLRQGAAVVEAVAGMQLAGGRSHPLGAEVLAAAAASLARAHDPTYGGFGPKGEVGVGPKFPPHMDLLFLLRHYQRTGDAQALEIVRHTCEQMARGGIYDQLA